MHCDGHPDCWDYSDEDSCAEARVCPTKQRCLHSKECLVQEWICDGEKDCKDGTDEKVCTIWQCVDSWSLYNATLQMNHAFRLDEISPNKVKSLTNGAFKFFMMNKNMEM